MASTQSTPLRMELMAVGENSNAWGDITNENLQMLEGATTSYLEISDTSTPQTLTVTDYTLGSYHNLVYKFTGSAGAAITYNVPAYERPYIIHNSCGQTITVKVSGQTGVDVATGTKAYVYCDGTDIRELVNNPASITATQTLTNKTLTAPRFSDGGFIADANGNELIVMDTVTSAVNELTVSNAASPAVTATMTIAAPAVVTVAATPPSGTPVVFTSTGTLPTGVVSGTTYFVKYINATTFNIAATTNGTSITTTGSQSGTHTAAFTGVPIIASIFVGAQNRKRYLDIGDSEEEAVLYNTSGQYNTAYIFGMIPVSGQIFFRYTDGSDTILDLLTFNKKCAKYETHTLIFLNAFGAYDSFTFVHGKLMMSNEKKKFEQMRWQLSGNQMAEKSGAVYNESMKTYAVKYKEKMMLTSDILSTGEYNWLSELVNSPQVYYYSTENAEYYPVQITDTDYEFKDDTINKAETLSITIEFSTPQNTQYR